MIPRGRLALGLIALGALWFIATQPDQRRIGAEAIYVIDGDTVSIGEDRYRLTGFDTPETKRADCAAEHALGQAATARLRRLIKDAKVVELQDMRGRDKFGRRLARLLVDGDDVGDILITEGLARAFRSGHRGRWC